MKSIARLFLFLIFPLSVIESHAGLIAADLRCEYQPGPVTVDATSPRLGWVLESGTRGDCQTAYRILVASSMERLQRDDGDLWDSGKVVSPEQNQIAYGGKPLAANQECFWKVQVWDQDDKASAWSAPARWGMGLLQASDWQAKWIGAKTSAQGLPLLRREFKVEKPLRRAVVHVCGLGHHELFLNGQKVGDHFLDPAWTVYEKTLFYSSHEITSQLQNGSNALGVMLGKGFYNTEGDRRVHGVDAKRPLKLILQAHLYFKDGTEQVVSSDGNWRTIPGPITHSAMLGGEDYDARAMPDGWRMPGFDDSGWQQAMETEGPGGELRAAFSPPVKKHDVFKPIRIDEPQPGIFVYDLGQNSSAIPRINVRGQAGQKIKLSPAEQRHGSSDRRNDGRGLVNPAGVGQPELLGIHAAWRCSRKLGTSIQLQRIPIHPGRGRGARWSCRIPTTCRSSRNWSPSTCAARRNRSGDLKARIRSSMPSTGISTGRCARTSRMCSPIARTAKNSAGWKFPI